jgi:hypothetical protein
VVQKTQKETFEHDFSFKDFMLENSVEISDTSISQFIKDCLFNLQSRFCNYFPEVVLHRRNYWGPSEWILT